MAHGWGTWSKNPGIPSKVAKSDRLKLGHSKGGMAGCACKERDDRV
jgi:hypothetical protein